MASKKKIPAKNKCPRKVAITDLPAGERARGGRRIVEPNKGSGFALPELNDEVVVG